MTWYEHVFNSKNHFVLCKTKCVTKNAAILEYSEIPLEKARYLFESDDYIVPMTRKKAYVFINEEPRLLENVIIISETSSHFSCWCFEDVAFFEPEYDEFINEKYPLPPYLQSEQHLEFVDILPPAIMEPPDYCKE